MDREILLPSRVRLILVATIVVSTAVGLLLDPAGFAVEVSASLLGFAVAILVGVPFLNRSRSSELERRKEFYRYRFTGIYTELERLGRGLGGAEDEFEWDRLRQDCTRMMDRLAAVLGSLGLPSEHAAWSSLHQAQNALSLRNKAHSPFDEGEGSLVVAAAVQCRLLAAAIGNGELDELVPNWRT